MRSRDALTTFIGAFLGIASIGIWETLPHGGPTRLFLIGSFGATCVIVYGLPTSPLAQPRNVIGGHVLSGLVGVAVAMLPFPEWLTSALAVSLSITVMQSTRTLHPPGGATALIATLGSPEVEALGFSYALYPVGMGASLLVLVAIATNRARALQNRMP